MPQGPAKPGGGAFAPQIVADQLLSPIPTRGVDYVHFIFSNLPPALPNQQERDLTCLVIDHKKNLEFLSCMYLCNGIFIRFHLHMPITPPILSEISKKNWMVKLKPFLIQSHSESMIKIVGAIFKGQPFQSI